jgi:hypothetical protein
MTFFSFILLGMSGRLLGPIVAFVVGGVLSAMGIQDQAARVGPLALFNPPARTFVARLDPLTLEPTGPRVSVDEYHWIAATSPDGSQLAVATGGPACKIRIIDIARMEMQHRVQAGIAAEALAWLRPGRVVAALACNPANIAGRGCGIVLVDSNSGGIVRRWPETEADDQTLRFEPGFFAPKTVAKTPFGVLFLLGHATEVTAARLVLIDDKEELRSLSLPSIRAGRHRPTVSNLAPFGPQKSAGLAIHSAGDRAYVIGTEPTIAEIDLKSFQVREHQVEGFDRGSDFSVRRAFWMDGQIVVYGVDQSAGADGSLAGRTPAGVRAVDIASWRARTIDAHASQATAAAGTLLAYGGESRGLTGYSPDGNERFRLFADDDSPVASVHVDGRYAYAISVDRQQGAVRARVVDVAAGKLVREVTPSARLIDLALP